MENKIKTCATCSKRLIYQKKFCSNGCYSAARKIVDLSKPKEKRPTEREAWTLFWDYHLPRMSYEQFGKGKKGGLPKDPFELATYKICEVKFYTDTFYPYLPSLEERAKMGGH